MNVNPETVFYTLRNQRSDCYNALDFPCAPSAANSNGCPIRTPERGPMRLSSTAEIRSCSGQAPAG
jgi:hypothetical protein